MGMWTVRTHSGTGSKVDLPTPHARVDPLPSPPRADCAHSGVSCENGCADYTSPLPRCAHLPPSTATHGCARIAPVPVPWDSLTDSFPASLATTHDYDASSPASPPALYGDMTAHTRASMLMGWRWR
jgi:hypothetical protein